jgi:hypothetical protein
MANREQNEGRRGGGQPWRGEARYGLRDENQPTDEDGRRDRSDAGGEPPTLSERDPAWRGDEREVGDDGKDRDGR